MSSTDNDLQVRVAGIVQDSVVDGPGLRNVVFAQGCMHGCPGCHNPQAQPMGGGALMSVAELWGEVRGNPLTMGLTISGGEPFLQPRPLAALARLAKGAGLSVWVFTGFVFEQLLAGEGNMALLRYADVLVDGPFVQELKTYSLPWRGSSNQRLINVRRQLTIDN